MRERDEPRVAVVHAVPCAAGRAHEREVPPAEEDDARASVKLARAAARREYREYFVFKNRTMEAVKYFCARGGGLVLELVALPYSLLYPVTISFYRRLPLLDLYASWH